MMTQRDSVERASSEMGTPLSYEDYVGIKIAPRTRACCCSNCWPYTWAEINRRYPEHGPIEHEGDLLVDLERDGVKAVVEQHETGPEVVLYLGATTAGLSFAKLVLDLILFILRTRKTDKAKADPVLRVTAREYSARNTSVDVTTVDVEIPMSKEAEDKVSALVAKHLSKVRKKHRKARR